MKNEELDEVSSIISKLYRPGTDPLICHLITTLELLKRIVPMGLLGHQELYNLLKDSGYTLNVQPGNRLGWLMEPLQ